MDWPSVRASGVRFAIAKATEGETGVDAHFQSNWTGIRNAGLVRGAYHFFRPTADAKKQADLFLSTVGALGAGDLAILDVETADGVSANKIRDDIAVWLTKVQTATGRKPFIYTRVSFWKKTLGNSNRFADHPLWIAHWTSAAQPTLPGGWTTWMLWQYSNKGTVLGIQGNVDLDRAHGAIENLTNATLIV